MGSKVKIHDLTEEKGRAIEACEPAFPKGARRFACRDHSCGDGRRKNTDGAEICG